MQSRWCCLRPGSGTSDEIHIVCRSLIPSGRHCASGITRSHHRWHRSGQQNRRCQRELFLELPAVLRYCRQRVGMVTIPRTFPHSHRCRLLTPAPVTLFWLACDFPPQAVCGSGRISRFATSPVPFTITLCFARGTVPAIPQRRSFTSVFRYIVYSFHASYHPRRRCGSPTNSQASS